MLQTTRAYKDIPIQLEICLSLLLVLHMIHVFRTTKEKLV
jgi:hypothetical protein